MAIRKRFSLRLKALSLMGAAMGVALAVSLVAVSIVYSSIHELERIGREDFQSQLALANARAQFKEQVQEWKNVLLRGSSPELLDKHWSAFEARERDVLAALREVRAGMRAPVLLERLEQVAAAHKFAGGEYRRGLEAFKAAGFDAQAGEKMVIGVDRPVTTLFADAQALALDAGARATADAVTRAEEGYRMAVAGTVAAMLGALAALWVFLRRAVIAPLDTAVRFAGAIERGDLGASIRSRSRDEVGELIDSLSRMRDALSTVVLQVRHSADAVAAASGQVSAGNIDLSQRTEEQATSLEETAASMEELASTVQLTAGNARKADELARNASKRAAQGGAEVGRVIETMSGISASARRIGDIIAVIDGIAFQTNILALNAAVEAARAGEQGRGFAVVAAEVRTLAQRSAQAAREIKALIGDSAGKVEAGTSLVDQAGATIQALVADVRLVSELMETIADASAEQSRGVQQVNRTVTEMEKVVQRNAAVVQQSAAGAESMRIEADALVKAVGLFRLDATPSPALQAGGRTATLSPALSQGRGGKASLEDFRRVVREPRALAAHEGHVAAVAPALEAVDHVGEAR